MSCQATDTSLSKTAEGGRGIGERDTTVFLSEDEALRLVFPVASRVIHDRLLLTADERGLVERTLGRRLLERRYRAFLGVKPNGELDGYAVIQDEIGKFKPFTFIVGVEPNGRVRRVAVLVYRESRGGEIASRRYLVQYPGKDLDDPIDKSRDIIGIQGATMSVDALNYGVRKVLAVVEAAYRSQPERLRRLLAEPAAGSGGSTATQRASDPPSRGGFLHVRQLRHIMGSLCEIRAYGVDAVRLREAVERAFLEIEAVDLALSNYRPDSELSRFTCASSSDAVLLSERLGSFLEKAKRLHVASGGAFDPTVGPVVRLWGFRRAGAVAPRLPTDAELSAVADRVGFDHVQVRCEADGTWWGRVDRADLEIDPGALGKGFALDRAAEVLRDSGVRHALLDFGSTVYALGAPPLRDGWRVVLRDPADGGRWLGSVVLCNEALSVSGISENRFQVDGVWYSHFLSPRTFRPVPGIVGAIVVTTTASDADGLSTAACVLGVDGAEFLDGRLVDGLVMLDSKEREPTFAGSFKERLEPVPALAMAEGSQGLSSFPRRVQ